VTSLITYSKCGDIKIKQDWNLAHRSEKLLVEKKRKKKSSIECTLTVAACTNQEENLFVIIFRMIHLYLPPELQFSSHICWALLSVVLP